MRKILFFLLLLSSVCHAQNPLTVFHGGTSRSSLDTCKLIIGANLSPLVSLSNASADSMKFLRNNGPNHLPTWETVSGGGFPPFPNDSTVFLRGDSTWAVIPGVSDAVITDPATAHRNLIQPTANGVNALELKTKSGSSSEAFVIDKNDGTRFFDVTNIGHVEVYKALDLSDTTTVIGLSTGGSMDYGSPGSLLTSNGASVTPSWVTNDSVLTNAVIINPLTASRNRIKGADVGLQIEQPASGTPNLLEFLQDASHTVLSFMNYYGGWSLGSSSDIDAASWLKVQQGSSVGMYLRAAASGSNILMRMESSSGTLLAKFDHEGTLSLGDMSTLPSTVASLNITQFSNTQPGLILKQSVTPGSDNLQQWRDNADNILAAISHKGLVIGGSTAGAYLDVQASAVNTTMKRTVTHAALDVGYSETENFVQTINAIPTLLHNFTTANNKAYLVKGFLIGHCTAGALAGKIITCDFRVTFQNIAGVLTKINAGTLTIDNTILNGSTVTIAVGAVNTTDIEINVTGVAANTIVWGLNQFIWATL